MASTTRLGLGLATCAIALSALVPVAHATTHGRVRAQAFYGTSLRGRPIVAYQTGDGHGQTMLVFGAIHGDETAGVPIARRLLDQPATPGTDIWVVPDLNPDGSALHRRQNADGIDLNRNFPYHWQPTSSDGPFDYPGPHPLSEPESAFAARLIRRLHPAITIWFHQALRVVDLSGGSKAIERRFAHLVGLPVRRLERYPGSGATWQNHRFPETTSFVVELPAGRLRPGAVDRYARAVVTLALGSGD